MEGHRHLHPDEGQSHGTEGRLSPAGGQRGLSQACWAAHRVGLSGQKGFLRVCGAGQGLVHAEPTRHLQSRPQ